MLNLFNSRVSYFLQCAQSESFNLAAGKIGITQSTLSTAIKKLEEDLGAVLFERTVSGIKLTSAGHALMEQLKGFQKQISKGVSIALNTQDLAPIKFASVPHFGSKFLFPYLKSKKSSLPISQIFLVWSFDGYKAVQDGEIDFAFVAWTRRPKELSYIEVRPDPMVYIGLKKVFPNLPKVRTQEELNLYPMVHLPKPQLPWTKGMQTGEGGFLARDAMSAKDLIMQGFGVGDLQRDIFSEEELKSLCEAALPSAHPHSNIYTVFRKDISTSARSVMERMVKDLSIIDK